MVCFHFEKSLKALKDLALSSISLCKKRKPVVFDSCSKRLNLVNIVLNVYLDAAVFLHFSLSDVPWDMLKGALFQQEA